MKKTFMIAIVLFTSLVTGAQPAPTDTVVVELAKTSKVIFTIKDRSDLETLKQYDFQALFNDIIAKLEGSNADTAKLPTDDSANTELIVTTEPTNDDWRNDTDDDDSDRNDRKRYRRSRHSFNFDFGTNNYLESNKFPDAEGAQYAVRPWGSWYIGFNSTIRTRVTKNFFLEWGLGVSSYNFKFQEDNTFLTEDANGVTFSVDSRDVAFIKSKLTVNYVNASFVPMLDFGGGDRKSRFWSSRNSTFRIGAGPYAGYRISSHTKLVYKEDGDREKEKDRDNFYLNNLRYGIRLQLGVRSADFFFNYDLNELFAANKGPKLNAFSFGVIF
jgi:hypothetical protein